LALAPPDPNRRTHRHPGQAKRKPGSQKDRRFDL